jgi:hypothetical protein
MSFIGDTAGPVALALRRLAGDEREQIKRQVEEAFASFATNGGYAFPGVSLVAVAD